MSPKMLEPHSGVVKLAMTSQKRSAIAGAVPGTVGTVDEHGEERAEALF